MMHSKRSCTLLPGLAILALAACSPQAQSLSQAETGATPASQTPSVHPRSGLRVAPLTITQDGRTHRFRVEVAATQQEQWMGLRFRPAMGADEGMIFPRDPPRMASFTMQNTEIPLDMIFIGADGVIDQIIAETTPFEPGPFSSEEPAAAVLELNGGTAARLGITPGARVQW